MKNQELQVHKHNFHFSLAMLFTLHPNFMVSFLKSKMPWPFREIACGCAPLLQQTVCRL